MLLCSKNVSSDFDSMALTLLERADLDLKLKDKEGSNALHLLLDSQRSFILTNLIENFVFHQPDIINEVNKDGMNALHLLCHSASYRRDNLRELIQLLINNRININAQDKDGFNALHHILCSCRNYKIDRVSGDQEGAEADLMLKLVDFVRLLIDNRIDVHATTKSGRNALQLFTNYNYRGRDKNEIIRLLVDQGLNN
jgi:ankyrin repeat protein